MIKDKKLGLKMTENKEETYWTEIKEDTEKDIERLEKLLKFNRAIIEMCDNKLNKPKNK